MNKFMKYYGVFSFIIIGVLSVVGLAALLEPLDRQVNFRIRDINVITETICDNFGHCYMTEEDVDFLESRMVL